MTQLTRIELSCVVDVNITVASHDSSRVGILS